MKALIDPYFENSHQIIESIFAETDYTYLFHFQNYYFGYKPDADGEAELVMVPLSEMLTLVIEALERLGLADAGMSQERLVELNLFYMGLLTMVLPNGLMSEEQFHDLTGTGEEGGAVH
jgi:hypothetical protein